MITAKKMTETSAKVSDKVTSKDFYLNNKKTKSNIDSIKSEMKKVVKAFNQIKSIRADIFKSKVCFFQHTAILFVVFNHDIYGTYQSLDR